VKSQTKVVRSCWQAMVVVAAILGACGPVQEELFEEGEGLGEAEQAALAGVSLGIVTGDIYSQNSGDQPLLTHNEQAFCEFSNLGAKWVRIEADRPDTDTETYQLIVLKAKAKGLKVSVLVPARYCGEDTQVEIDAFTTSYVSHLETLASTVFTGPAKVDAFEIGSQPNLTEQGCGDGVSRARVAPNSFAWLLRRVWDWKTTNARSELIISGGILNTYTAEPFWSAFFNSGAFTGFQGSRPFDYFGIHPYNTAHQDTACINTGATTCFAVWKNNVTNGLKAVASLVNTRTGTTGTQLFATQFGFQLSKTTQCPAGENCVLNDWQASAGMQAFGDAFVASGVTPLALYYNYRDDVSERYGLRRLYDGTKYPAKSTQWNKFRSMAGGAGSTNPEACWAAGTNYFVNFENDSDLRTTQIGDWAHGYYKGECAPAERVMGLSKSIANGWARKAVCHKDPLDGSRYNHVLPGCYARNIETGDNRGRSGPAWDDANYEGECAAGEYVAGIAQTQDHKLSHILCCQAPVVGTACETRVFASADNRASTATSGAWDDAGYKGECGVGQYVAGVSRTPEGEPNALLCCAQ
jgi:hypothetical protein